MFRSCVQSYKIYTEPPTPAKPKYEDAIPLARRMATHAAAHAPTGLQHLASHAPKAQIACSRTELF